MKNAKFGVHFEPVRKFKFKRGYEKTQNLVFISNPLESYKKKYLKKSSDN